MGTYISKGGPATQVVGVNRAENPRNVGWSTGVCVGFANDWNVNQFNYSIVSSSYGDAAQSRRGVDGSNMAGFFITQTLAGEAPRQGPTIPVGGGSAFDLSAMMWRNDAAARWRWRYRFADATAWVSSNITSPEVTGTGWLDVRTPITPPAGATRMYALIEDVVPLPTGERILGARLFIGTPGHAYFDGSSAPTADRSYQWTGTPDRSSSREVLGVPIVQPNQVDGYQAGRPGGTVVHRIIGSATPDVVMMPSGLRVGRLRLIVADATAAFNGLQALSAPEVFDLVSDERSGISMKFVIPDGQEIGLRLDDATRDVWILDVPFQEVGG